MSFSNFLLTLGVLTALVLGTFFALQGLHITTGSLIDWLVGMAILWWLAVVTTLPWNAHFSALHVVEEAHESRERGIVVNEEHVAFARRVASRFRTLAIVLHLATAALLFVLAYLHIVAVGYPAAIAALALTFARPAERAYQHLAERLRLMRHQVHYPREDVVELRTRLQALESQVRTVTYALDTDEANSWAHSVDQRQEAALRHFDRLDSLLEELTRQNARDHEGLARQTAQEIAKLSEDARFLNQVRELIQFVKSA